MPASRIISSSAQTALMAGPASPPTRARDSGIHPQNGRHSPRDEEHRAKRRPQALADPGRTLRRGHLTPPTRPAAQVTATSTSGITAGHHQRAGHRSLERPHTFLSWRSSSFSLHGKEQRSLDTPATARRESILGRRAPCSGCLGAGLRPGRPGADRLFRTTPGVWQPAGSRRGPGRRHAQRAVAAPEQCVALGLRQPTPYPIGLAHRQCVASALLHDRAGSTHLFGALLPGSRAGPRSWSGWKNRLPSSPRHTPRSCQSQISATGAGSHWKAAAFIAVENCGRARGRSVRAASCSCRDVIEGRGAGRGDGWDGERRVSQQACRSTARQCRRC